jgi:uridylate kinase
VLVKDVGGVFTDNPKKNPKAKLIKSMNFDQLLKFAEKEEFGAKAYGVLDLQAARIIYRSKIPTFVCGLEDIEAALKGRAGTKIE